MLLDKTYTADQEPKERKVKGQFTSLHRPVIYKSATLLCENITCADEAKCYGVSDEHIPDHINPYCIGKWLATFS